MFDAKVCEEIKSYVYALYDLDGKIFYIGEGVDNRCYQHIEEARTGKEGTIKLDAIREILNAGQEVRIDILRRGLDRSTALVVEAVLIDILNLKIEGGNLIAGHGLGRESAKEIQIRCGAKPLPSVSGEPLLLIKINDSYKPGMSLEEVYKITRWSWKMRIARAEKCRYVLGVANGIVRGVFRPISFQSVPDDHEDKGRVFFDGEIVSGSQYFETSAKVFGKKGQANPVFYLNV